MPQQLISLMALVAVQVAKCMEYDDLTESINNLPDGEPNADLQETTDNTTRQSKLLDIKVRATHKKRLLEMDSHRLYLKDIDTHKEVDQETLVKVQSILDCPWFSDETKAACLSMFSS